MDVFRLLNQLSKSNLYYHQSSEYQKIIEDTIMAKLEVEPDLKIENPDILPILTSYAISLKKDGKFNEAIENFKFVKSRLAGGILSSQQFKEFEEEFEKLNVINNDYITKDLSKDITEYTSFKEFLDELIQKEQVELKRGFASGNGNPVGTSKNSKTPHNIMSDEDKFRAIQELVRALRKEEPQVGKLNPSDIAVRRIGIGKDGYYIIPIIGTNISIYEQFNNDREAALYIVRNEEIEKVEKISRIEARGLDGVEAVFHSNNKETYNEYVDKILKKQKN